VGTVFPGAARNPECANAELYADILQKAYPHIIADIGGEAIMLDAREIELPYLTAR